MGLPSRSSIDVPARLRPARATTGQPSPSRCAASEGWCPRGDSNPHAVKHRLLRPACLPVPPPGQKTEGSWLCPTREGARIFLRGGKAAEIGFPVRFRFRFWGQDPRARRRVEPRNLRRRSIGGWRMDRNVEAACCLRLQLRAPRRARGICGDFLSISWMAARGDRVPASSFLRGRIECGGTVRSGTMGGCPAEVISPRVSGPAFRFGRRKGVGDERGVDESRRARRPAA